MALANLITTPVLDDTNTNTNTNINETLLVQVPTSPTRLAIAPETMTLHGERNVTNDSESTAVHDADELRSVIMNDPGTPRILLRAYDDLRGRISTSRDAIMIELSERVVNDLTKRLATINATNNDELATLRTRIIQLETRLRSPMRSASTLWYIDSDSTATTDTQGSTSDTYGRWNIASQRGSWQLRTTRVRHSTDGRHDDDDAERDDT